MNYVTVPAVGHMPFAGHRTQRQVREDQERLERDRKRVVTADMLEARG